MSALSPTSSVQSLLPTETDLQYYHAKRYGDLSKHGWRVQIRNQFGYYSPNLIYQYVVDHLVNDTTQWIDIGGGKAAFPDNEKFSRELADRCGFLLGVDPSNNIHLNQIVHERFQGFIEEFESDRKFDLVTLRMVAEHIEDPENIIAAIDRLLKPGGHVVIYTPNKWAPVAIAAGLTPFWLHPPIVKLLSNTVEEDVFPTAYKMNTRADLATLFSGNNFEEVAFAHLDNTSTLQRFKPLLYCELALRSAFQSAGKPYPENALLGVYQKPKSSQQPSNQASLNSLFWGDPQQTTSG